MSSAKNSLIVALTFDFDAESSFIQLGHQNCPSMISRGQYGAYVGVNRLLKLYETLNVPATAYIPGFTIKKYPDQCKKIRDAGIEIGHHGCAHEAPENKSVEEQKKIIECGLEAMNSVLNISPHGYRAPFLKQNQDTYELLAQYNFSYDTSECRQEYPYYIKCADKELVEIPTQYEWNDTPMYFDFSTASIMPLAFDPSAIEAIWCDEFTGMYEEDTKACYVHVVHPLCTGHPYRMKIYERFIRFMLAHENVTFLTINEICQRFKNNSL
jgi:peptidoglycan-N-acetylglucosamine deacetylase